MPWSQPPLLPPLLRLLAAAGGAMWRAGRAAVGLHDVVQ